MASVGSLISGSPEAYSYLAESIPRFYPGEELVEIIHQAGFRDVSYQHLTLGAVAVHKAVKPLRNR